MLRTDVAQLLATKYGKQNPPLVRAGDTVRVHQKIKEGEKERVQIFEGLVIAVKHGRGLDATFTVRKIAAGGVGVERTYPLHSPNVVKVERTKTAKVSRAKLYYMRDRMGKTARFKDESTNAGSWVEPVTVAETVVDDSGEDTADQIEEAVVEVANEQEAEAETPETTEGEVIPEESAAEVVAEEAAEPEAPAEKAA